MTAAFTTQELALLAILRAPGPKQSDTKVRAMLGLDTDGAIRLYHGLRTKLGVSAATSLRNAVRNMH
jgi:hypothetical protein